MDYKNENFCNKLLAALGENTKLSPDNWTLEHYFKGIGNAGLKKWIANILPSELLKRSVKDAVNSIVTLCECYNFYEDFPDSIETPNYGDKWGRLANYIEINNRAIAEMHNERCSNGILSMIKMLPAIPPSAKNWANCIIFSQIFPNIYGDGYNKPPYEENSVYGLKLNAGYSSNLIVESIQDKISAEEQLRAFNDLAHFRGIKTGFRVMVSEDQIKIAHYGKDDENFRWNNPGHQDLFINECVKLFNLGFESMFIDSAKHIGGYEMEYYNGVGALPGYQQTQYILQQIRERSGKTTISFVGEKTSNDFQRYKCLGLTTGTYYLNIDNVDTLKHISEENKYLREYAPGNEISGDNDTGGRSYEERIAKIRAALFGFELASDKLASFMQMEDIFPLRYDTNTHHLMMSNPSYSLDGTPESHWENLFTKDDGREYNRKIGEIFAYALNM